MAELKMEEREYKDKYVLIRMWKEEGLWKVELERFKTSVKVTSSHDSEGDCVVRFITLIKENN